VINDEECLTVIAQCASSSGIDDSEAPFLDDDITSWSEFKTMRDMIQDAGSYFTHSLELLAFVWGTDVALLAMKSSYAIMRARMKQRAEVVKMICRLLSSPKGQEGKILALEERANLERLHCCKILQHAWEEGKYCSNGLATAL
jgi:hypothetical protein